MKFTQESTNPQRVDGHVMWDCGARCRRGRECVCVE